MSTRDIDTPALEGVIGYSFKNAYLLIEALTHKSYYYENQRISPAHNERLEFLGDSVLGLTVSAYLFRQNTLMSEAMMSKVKSYVVKGAVLSDVARDIGLGDFLLIGKGEEDTGGREKSSLLTNAMESVIGAVYMDGGFEASADLIHMLFGHRLSEAIKSGEFQDYKTEFQEVCQGRFNITPQYRVTAQDGLEHSKVFTVEALVDGEIKGAGKGRSKKKAEQEAARNGLVNLNTAQ